MSAVHKLSIDYYDEPCLLIAIHTPLEDYTLAYQINKSLHTRLARLKQDIELGSDARFSVFGWEDVSTDVYWQLIANQTEVFTQERYGDLFQSTPVATRACLVPELKEVDYFIKVDEADQALEEQLLEALVHIPSVVTAFAVEYDRLKSKNNLIF